MTLTRLVIAAAGGWYVVARLCARRQATIHLGIKLGALATVLLLVGTLQLPYKLIFQSKFPAYVWHQQTCYATGERGDTLLMFCPQNTPPRNQIVPRSAPGLTATGERESIFTPLARADAVRSRLIER